MMDIVNLGHFANKYMIAPWVEWPQTAIFRFCRGTLNRTRVVKVEALKSALILARDTHHDILWHAIPEAWKARLETNMLQFSGALDGAQEAGHRAFLVDLYYLAVTRKGSPHDNAEFPHPGMSATHLRRLLAGYWSLSMLWLHLSTNPPPYDHQCFNPTACNAAWRTLWQGETHSAEMDTFNPADVLGRLLCIDTRLRSYQLSSIAGSLAACFSLITQQNNSLLMRIRTEVRDSLEVRFFGTYFLFCFQSKID
jgi:hypothetical protein